MRFNVQALEDWIEATGRGAVTMLHRRTGYSLEAISKLRRTAVVPRPRNLFRIAEVIGKSPQELILYRAPIKRRKTA